MASSLTLISLFHKKRLFPQLELILLYEPLKLVLWAPDTNKGKHTCINTIL